MKKILALILIITLFSISLCSCGKYVSSYRAIGLIRSNTSHSCKASFYSLEGELVFKLKRSDSGEGDVQYSVSVEEGEIHLYYDIYGTKSELARVKAGENLNGRGGYVEGGKTVYIIIEAAKGSRGEVSVELDG